MKTIDYVEELRYNWHKITPAQEKEIVEHFGENISDEFTEQDIWEQTRKIIQNS